MQQVWKQKDQFECPYNGPKKYVGDRSWGLAAEMWSEPGHNSKLIPGFGGTDEG